MASLSFLPNRRTNKRGKAVVLLRVSHNYSRKYISLDMKVNPEYWNENRQRVTSSHVAHAEINSRLAEIEREAQKIVSRLEASPNTVTASWLKEELKNALLKRGDDDPEGFLVFAHEELKNYKRQGQTGTHKSYSSVLNKFSDFVQGELSQQDIHFHRLTPSLLRDFRAYCYEVKGNATNTVGKALHVLRTFTRKAIKEGYIDQADYPFEHITIDSEETEREKLTPQEIEAIANLEMDPDSVEAEIRRWFLFAYYAGGMRFSDVATLKPEHIRTAPGESEKRIYYRMEKTEGMTGVPIIDEAQKILDYYDGTFDPWIFPILKDIDEGGPGLVQKKESMNAMANKYLKNKIAPRAGIEKNVSFHLSRNAAAWRLYKAIGDLYKVMKILGHSSIQQTEEYVAGFEDDSLDDDFRGAMS